MCECGEGIDSERFDDVGDSSAILTRRALLLGGVVLPTLVSPLFVRPAFAATKTGPSENSLRATLARYKLVVHERSDWAGDSRPAKAALPAEPDVRYVAVHHTVTPNDDRASQTVDRIRSIHRHHTTTKGWDDVAYNFLIDRFGGVWEARTGSLDRGVAGSNTGGSAGFNQMVCLIGDFASIAPPREQERALTTLIAALADHYNISTAPGAEVSFRSRGSNRFARGVSVTTQTIDGHRAFSQTTCPGDAMFARLPALRTAVHTLRASNVSHVVK